MTTPDHALQEALELAMSMITHSPFSHVFIYEEKQCEWCKKLAKIRAALAGEPVSNKTVEQIKERVRWGPELCCVRCGQKEWLVIDAGAVCSNCYDGILIKTVYTSQPRVLVDVLLEIVPLYEADDGGLSEKRKGLPLDLSNLENVKIGDTVRVIVVEGPRG